MDGGVQRGTHVLKALSVGAKAVGLGRYYFFPLAAAGLQWIQYIFCSEKLKRKRAPQMGQDRNNGLLSPFQFTTSQSRDHSEGKSQKAAQTVRSYAM
jgi:hypothetical protein